MTYRVLITGSRTWRDHTAIHAALDALHTAHPDMVLVHGACKQGADAIADRWATLRGVTVERHPARWATGGRGAGFARNREMVAAGADWCCAFIAQCADPKCGRVTGPHGSHGAAHCSAAAEAAGIPVRTWFA